MNKKLLQKKKKKSICYKLISSDDAVKSPMSYTILARLK